MRRLGKGGLDLFSVAEMEIETDIAGHFVIEDGCLGGVGEGGLGDRRQRVDVEGDQFGRVPGLRLGLGDDRGDRLADMADLVRGQGVMGSASSIRVPSRLFMTWRAGNAPTPPCASSAAV